MMYRELNTCFYGMAQPFEKKYRHDLSRVIFKSLGYTLYV